MLNVWITVLFFPLTCEWFLPLFALPNSGSSFQSQDSFKCPLGEGKEGKGQSSTSVLNEICFRICIFSNLSLRLNEAGTHAWENSLVVTSLLPCFGFAFLSVYLVTFQFVCQARIRLSVTCHIFQVFLGALSFVYFAKALAEGYLKSTITQIERRFDIPSSLVGVIDGSFEIGRYCRCLVLLLHTRSSRCDYRHP